MTLPSTHPDALATAASIRAGEVTAREVVEAAIARIEERDPALNAVVGRRYDAALAEVDAGLPAGPLSGVPFLVKDLGADVAGIPSTSGSRLFADNVPTADSEIVRRYKAAGLVVLGTTNSPEFGLNASTEPLLHGPARNPHDHSRSTGGSSGGSAAAVAAGMVPAAHATDGGGSIRIPAAACGLVGLKPSRGRTTGHPDTGTLAGPVSVPHAVTTSVRDSAALLDVIAGPLPGEAFSAPGPRTTFLDAASREPGRLRIGVATEIAGFDVDPACRDAVLATAKLCESLGHDVEEAAAGFDPAEVAASSGVLMGADLVVTIDDRLAELGREKLEPGDVEPFTEMLYGYFSGLTGTQVHRALRAAQDIGWRLGRHMSRYDVLLTPTLTAQTAPLGLLDTSRPEVMWQHGSTYSAWTSVFNVTGMPAISLPLGQAPDGMPIGVQFAADLGREELLISLAAQLETR
ncbi:amidase [Nocardioides sp. GY 10113]|uniref:amidase n=1 Tax=Nocardioides sp. GY 10113 TaxID=2569761 RepID=UPI0010A93E76|nr:amidase family protein [Nocardioides sp. GY 10113]TIC85105.1 amidase [Nocardioides sp. GY 10113]